MRPTSNNRQRLLGIYLDDHRAGAAGGVALARRMLESNPDNYLTSTMRELIGEIDSDRQLHRERIVDDAFGSTPGDYRQVGSRN
ncbi:MAG TPA: hypothetical protein VFV63_13415 [Ilumatobacteraceae bacterium]|nr:hypothetical protein [Ilumatobacteraceae bacterium]